MPKVDRREVIMQAAERLFTSRRFHEITLDDIVQAAHVGKGTVYTYFKDKDDLFFQVAVSGFDEMCDLLRRRVAGDAPFERQLLQACEAITAFYARRRELFRMIQSEDARMSLCHGASQEEWMEKRRVLARTVGSIIALGQAEGKVRPGLAPETLAHFLLSMLRARARETGGAEGPVSLELVVDLFLSGAAGQAGGVRRRGGRARAASEVH